MIDPNFSWLVSTSLLHSLWQGLLLAWLVTRIVKANKALSVHQRFAASFALLILISLTPLINYAWLSNRATPPRAVAIAAERYQSNQMSLWTIAELAEESKTTKATSATESLKTKSTTPSGPIQSPSATPVISSPNKSIRINWLVVMTTLFSTMYVVGACMMLARLALGMRRHGSLIRQCSQIDLDSGLHRSASTSAEQAATSLGRKLRSKVMLYQGQGAALVVGILRPVILLNVSLVSGLNPKQLEQIIAHELAHVYRWDPLTQWVQRLVESILFLHPAVWIVSRQVSTLREMCCDEWVAQENSRIEYAETLLHCVALSNGIVTQQKQIAVEQTDLGSLSLAATGSGAKQLAYRIEALLQPAPLSRPGSSTGQFNNSMMKWFVILVTSVTSAALMLSIAKQAWQTASQTNPGNTVTNNQSDSASGIATTLLHQEFETANPTLVSDPNWPWQPIAQDQLNASMFLFHGQELVLRESIPEDVEVNVIADEQQIRFAQWHFGDKASRRVAVVAILQDGQVSRLFLDGNRDRSIEMDEEIKTQVNDGKTWLADVNVEVREDGKLLQSKRQIGITPKKSKLELRINTIGFVAGSMKIGDQTVSVRRYDVDGNGIATDYRDRTWIDLNQDGSFDEITERHALQNTLVLGGERYSVRSDRLGHSLTLETASQRGSIMFQFKARDADAIVESVEGSLRDEAGFVIAVRAEGDPVMVPPGKYCIETLVIRVRDKRNVLWTLTLSRGFEMGWFDVVANKQLDVQLLDTLKLHATSYTDSSQRYSDTWIRPSLYTPNGLVITNLVNDGPKSKSSQPDESVPTNFQLTKFGGGATSTAACSGFN